MHKLHTRLYKGSKNRLRQRLRITIGIRITSTFVVPHVPFNHLKQLRIETHLFGSRLFDFLVIGEQRVPLPTTLVQVAIHAQRVAILDNDLPFLEGSEGVATNQLPPQRPR
ncbi:unnamed protein product [Lactuca virosa]|uniref:Uncharacterized protein n=1 Tax=Lactuca virosa TaxID=75947 RepID=A0AAU9LI54_9ASTR|nr:unnamed protein product [Lactuca virosa]